MPPKFPVVPSINAKTIAEGANAAATPEKKRIIPRRVSDLFVKGTVHFSEEQVTLFDDVIAHLSDNIETAARMELAVRLAPIPNAPPLIIRKLAFDDEIAVAAPVLTQSARIDDDALVENARTKGQGHLMAISRRPRVSAAVTDVIVVRGDRDVTHCIAGNPGADFSPGGYSTLVRRAVGDDALTECVGSRPDLPRNLYLQLLAKASEAVRKKLQTANPHMSREIREVIASVANRMATVKALLELRVRSCGLTSNNFDECLASFEGLKRSTAEKVVQLQRMNMSSRPS